MEPTSYQDFLKSRGPAVSGGVSVSAAAPLMDAAPVPEIPISAAAAAAPETSVAVTWEDPETHEAKPEPTRADKRIKRLWSEREAATARADRLEQELAELRTASASPASAAPETASTAAPTADALTMAAQARIRAKPDRTAIGTTYASYEDYVEDCAIWGGELAAEKRVVLAESHAMADREATQQEAFASAWTERKAAYPDFDDVISAATSVPISPVIEGVVKATPQLGADLTYWLATHPTDVARIAALPEGAQFVEMGKVIATVEATRPTPERPASTTSTKPVSRAPAAIAPTTRAAVPNASLADSVGQGYAAFEARRNADLRARARR